jgi:thiazole/oxazole-forming peptide maturase SagD family component
MSQTIAETVAMLNRALADDFKIEPLHLPDAPIFMAAAWPRAEGVTGLKPRLPAGRGITIQQAMLSAGAEALELRASLAHNHVGDFLRLERSNGRAMVKANDLLREDEVLVSAQHVYLDFAAVHGEALLVDADSTGCATGMTRDEATATALLECIERDAMAVWWHGHMQRAALPLELIDRLQPRLCWWLQERQRQTMLLELTTDTCVPVVAAVSSAADGSLVAIGTAANFNINQAALAAITEMIQTETAIAQAVDAGAPELTGWLGRASTRGMIQFQPLSTSPIQAKADLDTETILRGLAYGGHRALAVELTLPDDPLPTMRVTVPGLCAMGGQINEDRLESVSGRRVDLARLPAGDLFEPF